MHSSSFMLCNQTASHQLHYVPALGEGVNIPQLFVFQTHQFSLEIVSQSFFSTPWHSVVTAVTNWIYMVIAFLIVSKT